MENQESSSMTKRKSSNNDHRSGKRNFQAYLNENEQKLIDKAKKKLKVSTDRELIVALAYQALL
jgi:hypothetical protein